MQKLETILDRKTHAALGALAEKSNEKLEDRFNRIVSAFIAQPVPIADNIEPPTADDACPVATELDDPAYQRFIEQIKSRGLSIDIALFSLVIDHVDQNTPRGKGLDITPLRKKPVYLDYKPESWMRPVFWSDIQPNDIAKATSCSIATACHLTKEMTATKMFGMKDRQLVLKPSAGFEETTDQLLQNLLRAKLAGEDLFMTCGSKPAIEIKQEPIGLPVAAMKALMGGMASPNQLLDAIVRGKDDVVRFTPLGFVFDNGRWLVRVNEFLIGGGLLGEKCIALADIEEVERYVKPAVVLIEPKRRGRRLEEQAAPRA